MLKKGINYLLLLLIISCCGDLDLASSYDYASDSCDGICYTLCTSCYSSYSLINRCNRECKYKCLVKGCDKYIYSTTCDDFFQEMCTIFESAITKRGKDDFNCSNKTQASELQYKY